MVEHSGQVEISFDEKWYLSANSGVATAVAEGRFASGFDHYCLHGRFEGRLPTPASPSGVTLLHEEKLQNARKHHSGHFWLAPDELTVTPLVPKRALLVGSCAMGNWSRVTDLGFEADFVLTNNLASLGEIPRPAGDYDFQVVQLESRSVVGDAKLWTVSYSDEDGHKAAFDNSVERLRLVLGTMMKWNVEHGLVTFVSNFMVPQQGANGRLLKRYSFSNIAYFFERLNEALEDLVGRYQGAYLLDVDKISASIGRRYVQDDGVTLYSHGAMHPLNSAVASRIEPMASSIEHFDIRWQTDGFREAVWREAVAMLRVGPRSC